MDQEKPSPQTLDLLLALPAELRNEIYSYLLPYPLPDIIIRARYARLRWIVASRQLFNDVAPSLYNNSCFITYLNLDPVTEKHGTLVGSFHDHLHLTYGRNAPAWMITDACRLIRHIVVDIAAPDLAALMETSGFPICGVENILSTFSRYVTGVAETFPDLRSLRLCFQNSLMDDRSCPSNDLRIALLEAIELLRQSLPTTCELEALQRVTRNYNALSPLVLLPLATRRGVRRQGSGAKTGS